MQGVVCRSQKPATMSSLVNKALENHRKPDKFAVEYLETAGILDDDDPAKTREAEELIEYVDVFNEMISSKQYEQAAKHAASSPKGILRSYDTIKIFRQIDDSMDTGNSSELMFCNALMVTAKSTDNVSPGLSCEIIRCALKNQRLDLVSHWLCKNCLMYSLPMANLLMEYCSCKTSCHCGSVNLAKDIYAYLNAHRQAALCLLSAGKIHQMIQYGEDHKFTTKDYIFLCRRFPSTKLFLLLMSALCADKAPELISFPMVVNILIESNNITVLTEILQEIYTNRLISKDGRIRTLKDLMLAETISDDMTRSKWDTVVEICSENSLNDIAIELLSILTVREAMDIAAYKYLMDYIS